MENWHQRRNMAKKVTAKDISQHPIHFLRPNLRLVVPIIKALHVENAMKPSPLRSLYPVPSPSGRVVYDACFPGGPSICLNAPPFCRKESFSYTTRIVL